MVTIGPLLVALLLTDPAPPVAGTELPVRSLVLYRGQVAWVERAGTVAVEDGIATLRLDAGTLADTLNIDTAGGGPAPTAITADATGPLLGFVDPEWADHAPRGINLTIAFNGRAEQSGLAWRWGAPGHDNGTGKLALFEANGVSLVDAAEARQIFRAAPVEALARLKFPPEARSVELELSALVWGLFWTPQYRLTVLPDDKAALRLNGTAHNVGPTLFATENTSFSCRNPLAKPAADGGEGADDQGLEFSIGALSLPRGEAVTQTLLETELAARKVYVWNVGGVALENAPPPPKDALLAFLEVDHPDQVGLPAGPVTVTEGGRPLRVTRWPPAGAEPRSLIPLGPSNDLVIEREEVELERKRGGGAVADEDAPADWVVMTGSLSLRNRSRPAARVRVLKTFLGEGTAASDEGRIQRRPNQLDPRHVAGEIRWETEVPGGQTKRLTYGYQMVIPNR